MNVYSALQVSGSKHLAESTSRCLQISGSEKKTYAVSQFELDKMHNKHNIADLCRKVHLLEY